MSAATLHTPVSPHNLSDHKWGRRYGEVFISQHETTVLHCCVCDSDYTDYQEFLEHIFLHYFKSKTIEDTQHSLLDANIVKEELDIEREIEQFQVSPTECMLEIPTADSTLEHEQEIPVENPLADTLIEEEFPESKITVGEIVREFNSTELSSDSSRPSTPLPPSPKKRKYNRKKPLEKRVQTERPHKCATCGHAFKTRPALKVHSRRHTGDARYVCDVCDKGFYTGSELRIHKRTHTGDRPFVCTMCGARFTSSSWRNRHEKQHEHRMNNIRNYKCEVCGKCFLEAIHLKTHSVVHTGERKFACTVCNSKFLQQKHLYEHKKIHVNARQYACNICGKAFNQSAARLLHMKNKHKVVKVAPLPETEAKTKEPQQQE